MSKSVRDPSPASPYQQLRRDRPVKVDIHTSVPPVLGGKGKKVWIKPKSNSIQIPPEILEILGEDIEKRHVGQNQPEEVLFYQEARPYRETLRTSWATGLAVMLLCVSLFMAVAIWVYVPTYLMGAALLPPLLAIGSCALLAKRIRVDLAGCYALTKSRAIIVVPKKHLGFLPTMVLNYDFLLEKNLIMVNAAEARLQDKILTREPILADIAHTAHTTATVSFYPRTKFVIPFRFYNVQHSHAFELDFTDIMRNSPAPVHGGHMKVERPDFAQQQAAARRYKIYPILGAVWFLLIIGAISALLYAVFFASSSSGLTIAMAVLSWVFATFLSIASFYPVYSLSRQKRESIANNRYTKFSVEK